MQGHLMRKSIIVFLVIAVGLLLSSEWWLPYFFPPQIKIFPPVITGHVAGPGEGPIFEHIERATGVFPLKQMVQVLITAVLLCASIFVILAKRFGPKDKHWAYGTVGTIIGFWFK
jgi:hypothetical protein